MSNIATRINDFIDNNTPRSANGRALTHRTSHPGLDDLRMTAPHLMGTTAIPNQSYNAAVLLAADPDASIADQGQLGICSAKSCCNGPLVKIAIDEGKYKEPFSAFFTYSLENYYGGDPGSAGADYQTLGNVCKTYGAVTNSIMPDSGQTTDINLTLPSLALMTEATKFKTPSYSWLVQVTDDTRSQASVDAICAALAQGYIVLFGIIVCENFMDVTGPNCVIPIPSGDVLGLHSIRIIDYNCTTRQFLMYNTWGASWGDNGAAWMSFDWVTEGTTLSNASIRHGEKLAAALGDTDTWWYVNDAFILMGSNSPIPSPIPVPATPVVKSIVVTPELDTIEVGATAQLKAIATMSDNSLEDVTDIVNWQSCDLDVANVCEGLVTGISPGVSKVDAEDGMISSGATITVTAAPTPAPKPVGVTYVINMQVGAPTFTATVGNITKGYTFSAPTIDSAGRATAEISPLFTALGAIVNYNAATKHIAIIEQTSAGVEFEIDMAVGSPNFSTLINKTTADCEFCIVPFIDSAGRTVAEISPIFQAIGATVTYNATTKQIVICN